MKMFNAWKLMSIKEPPKFPNVLSLYREYYRAWKIHSSSFTTVSSPVCHPTSDTAIQEKEGNLQNLLEGAQVRCLSFHLRTQPQRACCVHWHVLGSRRTLPRLSMPRSKCDSLELLRFRLKKTPLMKHSKVLPSALMFHQDDLNICHPQPSCSFQF